MQMKRFLQVNLPGNFQRSGPTSLETKFLLLIQIRLAVWSLFWKLQKLPARRLLPTLQFFLTTTCHF